MAVAHPEQLVMFLFGMIYRLGRVCSERPPQTHSVIDAGAAIGVAHGIANPEAAQAALLNAAQAFQTWIVLMLWPF